MEANDAFADTRAVDSADLYLAEIRRYTPLRRRHGGILEEFARY